MQIDAHANKVISFLPSDILEEWSPHFELVELKLGQVLQEPARVMGHLYFPLTAIVSWVRILENGASTKVAITGREGVVGIYFLMGSAHTHNRTIIQKAGTAVRIRLSVVLNSFNQGNAVQRVFLRYAQALLNQMAQGSICHKHHSLEQQLCCMLLLTLDRQDNNIIFLTHELIANLLGFRREGVTQAAHRLMYEDIINYSRGHITVLNRAALNMRTCECYGVISDEYRSFLDT